MSENTASGCRLAFMTFGAILALEAFILLLQIRRDQAFLPGALFLSVLFAAAAFALNGGAWGKRIFILLASFKPILAVLFLVRHDWSAPLLFGEKIFLALSVIYLFMAGVIWLSKDIETYFAQQRIRRGKKADVRSFRLGAYTPFGVLWVFWTHLNIAYLIQGVFIFALAVAKNLDGEIFQLWYMLPYLVFCAAPTAAITALRIPYLVKRRPMLLRPVITNVLLLPALTLLSTFAGYSQEPYLRAAARYFYPYDPIAFVVLLVAPASLITAMLRVLLISKRISQQVPSPEGPRPPSVGSKSINMFFGKKKAIVFAVTFTAIVGTYFTVYRILKPTLVGPDAVSTSKPIVDQACFEAPTPACVVDLADGLLPELEQSDGIAYNLHDLGKTYFALGKIDKALGHERRALAEGHRISGVDQEAYFYVILAKTFADQGEYDLALEAVRKIKWKVSRNRKDSALSYVIHKMAVAGEYQGALEAVSLLGDTQVGARNISHESKNAKIKIAEAMAANGNVEQATTLLLKEAATFGDEMFFKAALVQSGAGLQGGSAQILEMIASKLDSNLAKEDHKARSRKLAKVASHYARIGLSAKAKAIFNRSMEEALAMPDANADRHLESIAIEAAKSGLPEVAFVAASKILDLSQGNMAAKDALRYLVGQVSTEEIIRGMKKLKRPASRKEAVKALVRTVENVDDTEPVFHALKLIEAQEDKDLILEVMTSHFAEKGALRASVRALGQIRSQSARAEAHGRLAFWAAKVGNVDLALEHYRPDQRDSSYVRQELAKHGYFDSAIGLWNDVDEEAVRLTELREFIRFALDAGQTERAESLIGQFASLLSNSPIAFEPHYRWQSSLAWFYSEVGQREQALETARRHIDIQLKGLEPGTPAFSDAQKKNAVFMATINMEVGLDLLNNINGASDRAAALIQAAEMLGRNGDNKSARFYLSRAKSTILEQVGSKFRTNMEKDNLLERLVAVLIKVGARDDALLLVDHIENDQRHSLALSHILKELDLPKNDRRNLEILWRTRRTELLFPKLIQLSQEMVIAFPPAPPVSGGTRPG